jgi:hypothetical protein
VHPLVAKIAAVVPDEGHLTGAIITLKTRKQSQIHHSLKPITDADNQISFVNEPEYLLAHIVQQLGGKNYPGTVVIAPAKTADKDKNLVVVQSGKLTDFFTHEKLVDVDSCGLGPSQFEGMSGLPIAVQTKARKDQGLWGTSNPERTTSKF